MKYVKLEGICKQAIANKLCLGCNRLELEDFKGLAECRYVKQPREHIKEMLGIQERIKL